MVIYFSGTGNSRYAAEVIASELKDELQDAGEYIKAGSIFVGKAMGVRGAHVLLAASKVICRIYQKVRILRNKKRVLYPDLRK